MNLTCNLITVEVLADSIQVQYNNLKAFSKLAFCNYAVKEVNEFSVEVIWWTDNYRDRGRMNLMDMSSHFTELITMMLTGLRRIVCEHLARMRKMMYRFCV